MKWLWDQRLPSGHITNLSGDPGVGKGHLMASIIGMLLREGTGRTASHASVVMYW